ncbi:phosphatidate cytidylyltransferase [Bacteroidia bacterium]|nr:phosphatidate cytidylyltransferase [Bacteroidia bacterium]GHU58345.1 phosphatidate cytidylyltransferase [Bacteroidia bacterium]
MKNQITRTITGIIYVAMIVGGLCVHPYLFLLVFSVITGLMLWEFYGLLEHYGNISLDRPIITIGGVYLFIASFVYAAGLSDGKIFLPYILFLMYLFISELYNKKTVNHIHNWSYKLFGQVYCAAPFTLLNFIALGSGLSFTPWFVLALFVFVWINDSGAFLVGSQIGKHRLFERISPKKSWEGFVGGALFTLASSLVFAHYFSEISLYIWLGLSATIVVFATLGDLTESLLKRTLGVKDSGKLLPGHGGMLDRFDSIIMAIPALYIYLKLFIQN